MFGSIIDEDKRKHDLINTGSNHGSLKVKKGEES